jgi:hypothetical protein
MDFEWSRYCWFKKNPCENLHFKKIGKKKKPYRFLLTKMDFCDLGLATMNAINF